LKAESDISGNIKHLDLRVGKISDYTFFYDLTNSKWSVVKITPDGWSIIEKDLPILFKRYSNQQPQATPAITYSKDIFDRFIELLNIQGKDTILLVKCYIISLFIPEIPKPILMLHGEQGSTKTTFQELIKMLVDPSIVKTLSFPRDINELIQKLSHNYIAYFDNISLIKDWISNELCRAVTGSGFSKRELWTNDDDIIYTFKRCIGFNGINLGATKADLLDRGIIIQLERIPKEKRKKIEKIWIEFEKIKPQLLGYIFDILTKMLRFKKENAEINLSDGFNRMADFEEYAEIISRCMNNPEDEFLRVYQENIGIQIDEAIEASPLSITVIQLCNKKDGQFLEGTATQLLNEINYFAENELKMNISKMRSWIKTPNSFSHRLNEIKTNLRERGIDIERYKDKKGNRIIKICKGSSRPSDRQEFEDQAQNQDKSFDDDVDDSKEEIVKRPSNQNQQKQAQNNSFGRFDDVDDDLHIKVREYLAKGKTLKCHHKGCKDKEYYSLIKYNNHCFSSHPKQPLYPELSLIQKLLLYSRENPWE
jgi:hypothetical protein